MTPFMLPKGSMVDLVERIGSTVDRICERSAPEGGGRGGEAPPLVDRKQWITDDPEKARTKRKLLWDLKENGNLWLPKRTRACHRCVIGGAVDVSAWVDDSGHRRANYRNLETCSNANACPLCAYRIRTVRAFELAEQAQAWKDGHGGDDCLSLLTLTHRHNKGHRLLELLEGQQRAFRRFKQKLRQYLDAWGWAGEVRAVDSTHGENGWHPHFHILVFWDQSIPENIREQREHTLSELWIDCVTVEMGPEHAPNEKHGVDLSGGAEAAKYVAKLAFELSDPLSKKGKKADERDHEKGRTPFELLDAAGGGDEGAGFLFREHCAAFKGRRIFEYSRRNDFKATLRKLAGQDAEKTDEELMRDGDRGTVELQIPKEAWSRVCLARGVRVEVLSKLEREGAEKTENWLRASGYWGTTLDEMHAWLDEPLRPPPEMTG